MRERSFYDPMSIYNSVDEIYSRETIREEHRALRARTSQYTQRQIGRVIRVQTVMNDRVAELLGTTAYLQQLHSHKTPAELLDNDAATENELPIIENR